MNHLNRYLCALFLCVLNFGLIAQTPQNRTVSTRVADALAQLPAETPQQYQQIMSDLVSTGEDGLLHLVANMHAPGKGNNEIADYAISGWTNFVANDANKKAIALKAYTKALRQPIDNEIKATLIRQLERIGDDSCIDVLKSLLDNKRLSAPATQALASIGTEKANSELLTVFANKSLMDAQKINIVNAIAKNQYFSAETQLIAELKKKPSLNLQDAIFRALGTIGGEKSIEPLKKVAESNHYLYKKNGVVSAYFSLLNRLNNKNPQRVKIEAEKLLEIAKKKNDNTLRFSAIRLLQAQKSTDKIDILRQVLTEDDIVLMTNVINNYPYQNEPSVVTLMENELRRTTSAEKQTALIYWFGKYQPSKSVSLISPYVNSENTMVRKAAITTLADIGDNAALAVLATLFMQNDLQSVSLAQDAMSTYKGDLSATLSTIYEQSSQAGKIAVLQLIAQRKIKSRYPMVIKELGNKDKTIRREATKTLQHVVTPNQLPELFLLLEQTASSDEIPFIQQAINNALSPLPAEKQHALITEKMNLSTRKNLYYSALANTGTQQALSDIVTAYQSGDVKNKDAAFEALTQWKSFDVVYPFLELARATGDKNEQGKIAEALLTIISKSDKTDAIKYLYLRETLAFAQNDKVQNKIIRAIGQTNMYQAMSFLSPWMKQSKTKEAAAQAIMKLALDNPQFAGKKTAELLFEVSKNLNNPDADYQREAIKKYCNDNVQEKGFESIFNGKDLAGWQGWFANPIQKEKMSKSEREIAQKKADKEAAINWNVQNGELVFSGKGDNLCTKKAYGDFEMLVDWKLYPGKEPDAGIYLRGTPQVQIWDTARVNVGAQVGSGGLYNNKMHPSKPLKVADEKVGEWNTFRVRMIGDRVSVWLNGELVTDNVILENYWDRNQSIFPIEHIELQAHGSKVAYRDIYVKEIERPEPFELSNEEKKEGFIVLFDGTNMHEWTGNTQDYILEDGLIVMHPSQRFGGNLYTKQEFDNFIFRFEFMLTPGANNGLGIRTPMEGDAAYVGMELQILDNEAPIYKNLQPYQYHGSVYGVIPAKRGFLKPTGEWNYQEVIADGDHIKVILNGETILDGNIRNAAKNGTMDKKEHPGLFNKTGHIGFLGHGSKVKFRNIRVKRIK